MGWHRTPRKLLSAWAYQDKGRSIGKPRKRWADSFEEDLKGAGFKISTWHMEAQDKLEWKDKIAAIGEPKRGRGKKRKPKAKKGKRNQK